MILSLLVAGMLGEICSIYTWLLLGINTIFALTFLNNESGIDCCQHYHDYKGITVVFNFF